MMRLIDQIREQGEIRRESLRSRIERASDRAFGYGRALVKSGRIPKPKRPALSRDRYRED